MALFGYDRAANGVNILRGNDGRELARLPASLGVDTDGTGIDLSIPLRNLSASDYRTLNIRRTVATTKFRLTWTNRFPEFDLGDLSVSTQVAEPSIWKRTACIAATTANLATLTSAAISVVHDGQTLVEGDRLLLSR